jgi:glycine oxidase
VPGKGQMLATEPLPPLTERVVLGPITGLRQRRNGQVVIGSDVEYVGFDKQVQQATVNAHFERAVAMLPALREAHIGRTWAGLRPMSPDGLPIVGAAPGVDGLWIATGHSRTGMSYGPGSGCAIADLIARGTTSLPIGTFDPARFVDQSQGQA